MSDTIDFLKGLNKSAFNLINPFSNDKMSDEELTEREQEFSDLSYAWNSYYTQRFDLEETMDRINYINKAKKAHIDRKEFLMKYLNKDISEEVNTMFIEYDKELEQLEFHKKIQMATMNYAQKNLGGIQKYITAPLYDVLVDVSSVTDIGDVISVGRIGLAAASAGIGASIATGASQVGLGTIGTAVAGEAVTSIADTALDVARVKDDTGEDLGISDIATMYGTNVVSGLAMQGIGAGLGYAFGKIFGKAKSKINKFGAEAVNSPNAPKINPDLTSNNTVGDVPETVLKTVLGEDSGEQMSDIIKNTVVEKFDSFDNSLDIRKSTTLNMATTTPEERKIMNTTLKEFKESNKIKSIPENEFIKLPSTQEIIKMKMNKKSTDTINELTNSIVVNARNTVNTIQNIAKQKGVDPSSLISPNSTFVKEWVNTISILREETLDNMTKQINFNISSRGAQIGINNYADFVNYSKQNNIDIMRSMYLDELTGNDLPKEYKEVFGYIKDLTYKYSIGVTPREVFSSNDSLIETAEKYGLSNFFSGVEYTPNGWDFETGSPMMFNSNLTKTEFIEGTNKIREYLQGVFSGKINVDELIPELDKTMEFSKVYDSKKNIKEYLETNLSQNQKNMTSRLRELGLTKRQATDVYKKLDLARRELEVDTSGLDLIESLTKDFGKRETIKNKLFSFIPKNQALLDEDLFMVTKIEGTDIDRTVKEFAPKDMVDKNRKLSKEELDRRDSIVKATEKYLNGNINPKIENAYFGLELPLSDGKTKHVDIRTTPASDLIDSFYNSKRRKIKDWRKLPEDKIVKLVDEIALNLHTNMTEKVGTSLRLNTGIDDPVKLIDYELTNWGIDKNKIQIVINNNSTEFNAFVTKIDNDKTLLNLSFTNDMNTDLKLGVTRHELQHIYDTYVLNSESDELYNANFRNTPTLKGSEILDKILNNQNATIREMTGAFYENHFYSPSNDNFENSYLGAVARDQFNKRTAYEKTQDFYSILKSTTQTRSKNRTHIRDIFRFLAGAEDIPDFLTDDYFEDFAIKSFISPQNMYDYVDFLADTGNNKIKNVVNNFSKIANRMGTEETGFSINGLLNQLTPNKARNTISQFGLNPDDYLNNTNVEKALASIKQGLRDKFSSTSLGEYDPLSKGNVGMSLLSSTLIGARQMTESFSSPVALGIAHILNGGSFKEGALLSVKGMPTATKNYFKSYLYATGTAVENFGNFTNALINSASQRMLDIQFKQNLTTQIADVLHKFGDIKSSEASLMDTKLLSEFNTQMSILSTGGDPEVFLSKIVRILNNAGHGNAADDIQLQALAQAATKSEFYKMLDVSDFVQLNATQKKMFSVSGFTNDQFKEWQNYTRKILNKNNFEIPEEATTLKIMLAHGEGALDIMGMSRRTSVSNQQNPFLFMAKTMYNALLLGYQKAKTTNVNGISIDSMELKNFFGKAIKMLGPMAIGIGGTIAIKDVVESSLFNRKTTLDEFGEAWSKYEEDPAAGSLKLATAFVNSGIELTPFSYGISPSQNKFGPLGIAGDLFNRNVYNTNTGEFRDPVLTLGLFAAPIVSSRLLTIARQFEDKSTSGSGRVSKKQLTKQIANDLELYLPHSYNTNMRRMKRQYNVDKVSVNRQ